MMTEQELCEALKVEISHNRNALTELQALLAKIDAELARLAREGGLMLINPTKLLRATIPADDPIRIEFEAAAQRIQVGDGVYADPFCPDCTIVRVSWTERYDHYWICSTKEYPELCERHKWRETTTT